MLLIGVLNLALSRRRKLKSELDRIESWGAFSSEQKEVVSIKNAGGAVDSTSEVIAETEVTGDESEESKPNQFDWDNV